MPGLYLRGVGNYLDRISGSPDGGMEMLGVSHVLDGLVDETPELLESEGFTQVDQTEISRRTVTVYRNEQGDEITHTVERAGCSAVMQTRISTESPNLDGVLDTVRTAYKKGLHPGADYYDEPGKPLPIQVVRVRV